MAPNSQEAARARHDAAYRSIFAHKRAVADTLSAAAADIARDLDLTTLQPLPASFVTKDLKQRHADMLWQVQTTSAEWLYVVVLLEFQSTVQRHMALRMTDYTVRILRSLTTDKLGPGGAHPPVLPIVVYNGQRRWTAPRDTQDLFGPVPDGLLEFLPRHRYLLVDVHRLDPAAIGLESVLAVIVQLERATTPEAVTGMLTPLDYRIQRIAEPELRGVLGAWVRHVLARRFDSDHRDYASLLLQEGGDTGVSTIGDRMERWGREDRERWLARGIETGRIQGIETGRIQGIETGRIEGIETGRIQGVETGRIQGERRAVLRLAARRFGPEATERLRPLLEELSDPDAIAAVFDAVFESVTADELFTRVGNA